MKVRPAGIDHNTGAIDRPFEHGNAYFGCTGIRNWFKTFWISYKTFYLLKQESKF